MTQCNILGRSETRACKRLDKAKEKINKLKVRFASPFFTTLHDISVAFAANNFCLPTFQIRLQEVEMALEEKENEILRYLKASSKYKPKQINLSYIEQNVNSQTMEDQTVRPYATKNSGHISFSSNGP